MFGLGSLVNADANYMIACVQPTLYRITVQMPEDELRCASIREPTVLESFAFNCAGGAIEPLPFTPLKNYTIEDFNPHKVRG